MNEKLIFESIKIILKKLDEDFGIYLLMLKDGILYE